MIGQMLVVCDWPDVGGLSQEKHLIGIPEAKLLVMIFIWAIKNRGDV